MNANLLDNGGTEVVGSPGRPVSAANAAVPVCIVDRWWGHRGGAGGYLIGHEGGNGLPHQIGLARRPGDTDTTSLTLGQSTGRPAEGESTLQLIQPLVAPSFGSPPLHALVFSVHARCGANFSGTGMTLEIVSSPVDANICTGPWVVETSATIHRSLLPVAYATPWRRFQVVKWGGWIGNPAFVLGVRVRFDSPSGVAGPEDSLFVAGMKLEASTTGAATAYVMPKFADSLVQCKRFYQAFGRSAGQPDIAVAGHATGGGVHRHTFPFPVEMIRAPKATKTGTWATTNCTQPVVVAATTRSFVLETDPIAPGPFAYGMDSVDDQLVFDAEQP